MITLINSVGHLCHAEMMRSLASCSRPAIKSYLPRDSG